MPEIRKKDTPEAEEGEESEASGLDAQEIFRRHFEAQFKPLPAVPKFSKPANDESGDGSEGDSDWDGISDDEENAVQVVEHTERRARTAAMSKEELKSFMVFLTFAYLSISNRIAEL
jgi:hypothetical protein